MSEVPRVKRAYNRRDPQGPPVKHKHVDHACPDTAHPWPVDHLIEMAVREKARTIGEVVIEVMRTRPNADKNGLATKIRSWIVSKRLIQEGNLLLYLPDRGHAET